MSGYVPDSEIGILILSGRDKLVSESAELIKKGFVAEGLALLRASGLGEDQVLFFISSLLGKEVVLAERIIRRYSRGRTRPFRAQLYRWEKGAGTVLERSAGELGRFRLLGSGSLLMSFARSLENARAVEKCVEELRGRRLELGVPEVARLLSREEVTVIYGLTDGFGNFFPAKKALDFIKVGGQWRGWVGFGAVIGGAIYAEFDLCSDGSLALASERPLSAGTWLLNVLTGALTSARR